MLNTAFNYNNTSNINLLRAKPVVFTGDSDALLPMTNYGLRNQDKIITSDKFVKRADINEEQIIKTILDENNKEPALITGKPNSGKSTTARKIVFSLKEKGHNVICIEGTPFFYSNIADKSLKVLKQIEQLNSLNPDERTFVFLDEPQFLPLMEKVINPKCSIADCILIKLYDTLINNPNIKLVGVMYSNGFELNRDYNDSILKELFPEKNHIEIPELNKNELIKIIDNILKLAGFRPMPNYVCNDIYNSPQAINPKKFLKKTGI